MLIHSLCTIQKEEFNFQKLSYLCSIHITNLAAFLKNPTLILKEDNHKMTPMKNRQPLMRFYLNL